jgi:predicted deacylase
MTSTPSRIRTTIALDVEGRRFGQYRIPYSDNTQPYGHVGPIAVLASGHGPTLVLTGGVHGDEYAGPVAIMRLAHELGLDKLNGRLILLPALNAPAVKAASRCSPLDGGNLNRAFPGDPDGGPTAMIAHWLETRVLPHCDGAIDFHSGGRASDNQPVEIGVDVSAGDLAGWIRDPFEIQRPPTRVCFEIDGHLAIRCSRGYVQAGEKLFGLVTDRQA